MPDQIQLHFPDGSVRSYDRGVSGLDVARSISEGLARVALGIKVDDQVRDLTRPITGDAAIRILTWDDPEGRMVFWHSSAHLMAEALEALYPGVKFGIGPAIENGFYYDIDLGGRKLTPEELGDIEKKMTELARQDAPYIRSDVSKADALKYFTEKQDEYKLELIEDLPDGSITFYKQGNFTDLCRGPHLPSTGRIKAIKLLTIAGAYWRGDEKRPQLTRIYGVTFPKKKDLDEHLERLEQARLRDHRKLGRELDLFTFSTLVGPGLPLWTARGTIVREQLSAFLRQKQLDAGYQPVVTPHIARLDLYRTSGHYPYYSDSQFPPMIEGGEEGHEEGFLLKPMNCPMHIQLYADKPHSYKELPIRMAEFGTVYRYEQSGELGGLTRVRGFTQDDAHIFCRPDQVKEEVRSVIQLTLEVLDTLKFTDFKAQISLRDPANKEKYIGDEQLWIDAENAVREAAAEAGLNAVEATGEAAFYGPKIDFMVRDAIGREWQLGTVQVDYNLPQRFDLAYVGEDNQKHRPVMIHRAPFGSLERFIGVLIEHCAGNFPTWLAPVQVAVLPIGQDFFDYATRVADELKEAGIRVDLDLRSEKIGYKIRNAELQKVPYMLVLGGKEAETGTVSVREHRKGAQDALQLDDFIQRVQEEVATRAYTTH